MSMSSKTTPFSLYFFVKQLAGLIEVHLDLGHIYHGSTGLKKHLPSQVPA